MAARFRFLSSFLFCAAFDQAEDFYSDMTLALSPRSLTVTLTHTLSPSRVSLGISSVIFCTRC